MSLPFLATLGGSAAGDFRSKLERGLAGKLSTMQLNGKTPICQITVDKLDGEMDASIAAESEDFSRDCRKSGDDPRDDHEHTSRAYIKCGGSIRLQAGKLTHLQKTPVFGPSWIRPLLG
jgi:hypothetical protein